MTGACIPAFTGQIAELRSPMFPMTFVAGAVVTAFSGDGYVKMSDAHPCAGGIGITLKKA